MVKRAKTFEELCEDRKKWVEISKKNNFDEGILKLLTELYPDKAHFVYELLQNAEDAKATQVSFKLYRDKLEFIHNGSRLFNLEDIDSITSIANTTKTKEDHSIGKFGVGFKAVFSYTKSPQIYSGEWCFEIDNLVVPTPIKPLKDLDSNKTYFVFPFNNPSKSPDRAYMETADGLRKLKPEALLFLNNIQEISYEIDKEHYRIFKNENKHIVSLYRGNQETPVAKYLRFVKNNIELDTSNGLMKKLSVALAYKLEEDTNGKIKIIPTNSSEHNVFIYFPAEKENSKLRFLINAPFDSEVSRASIRDTDDNALLIDEIVKLQIETMSYLLENGYLTTEFLGVLPNSQDALPKMYEVFHTRLVDLFNTESYTPAISGDFFPANGLFRGSLMYTNGPHISEFITDSELVKILKADDFEYEYDLEPPLWVKNALQNSPSAYFLHDLDLNKFGVEDFYQWLGEDDERWDVIIKEKNNHKKEVWRKIIEKKDFNDLVKLYKMLYQYFEENGYLNDLDNLPLFRCTDGQMYSVNDTVYIIPEEDIPEDILNSFHFIDKKSFGTSKQKNDVYRLFVDHFQIEEFSEKSICEEMLKKYQSSDNKTKVSEHIQDIKLLLKHYDDNKGEFNDILKDLAFILTTDNKYVSIDKVYSDIRYGNDHNLMKEAKNILGLDEINIVYKEKLTSKQVENFISILEDLGIHKLLWCVKCRDNPQKMFSRYDYNNMTSECKDFNIYKLDNIISELRQRPKLSELIWKSVMNIDTNTYTIGAVYRRTTSFDKEFISSQYVYTLSNNPWILTRGGILQKPQNITFDDLPAGWTHPKAEYEHPILKAIGFGRNSEKQREEQIKKDQAAKAIGLENAKEADELKKLRDELKEAGVTHEELRDIIQRKKEKNSKSLPQAAPKNPERRKEKILQENSEAIERGYETRERSVRTTDTQVRKDARQYLTNMYTNEDGEMFCQMCQDELPFKKKDGQYYFESTEICSMEKEDMHQYLALCPNCAAEYNEWVRNDEKTVQMLKNKIAERRSITGEQAISIDFYIHNECHSLYFTRTHYDDLRTVVCPNADNDTNQSHWVSLDNKSIPLEIGDTVRHEKFGEGIVKDVDIAQSRATVCFADAVRTIQLSYLDKKGG